jgi:Tol biopolymer transport system component/mono/diheme cytochrome c family protein
MKNKLTRIILLAGLGLLALAAAAIALGPRLAPAPAWRETQTIDELRLTLSLDRAEPGQGTVSLLVQDMAGAPVEGCAAALQFRMTDMDMGQVSVSAAPAAPGRYEARGPFFSMVGNWQIDNTLTCPRRRTVTAVFGVPIAASGEQSGPLNPLSADRQTLAAGQKLYVANCASCHGDSGRGDGPGAAGLNPPPADFRQHMTPGQHTDGQVYLWIRHGYPGSAMPAWEQRLSEEQIWQLVVYLRQFGQPAAASPTEVLQDVPESQEPLPALVFVRDNQIWSSDGRGGPPVQLSQLPQDHSASGPAISPDGGRIAFVAASPPPVTATVLLPRSALYTMRADGSDLRAVWTPAEGTLSAPAWSPDGAALYVAANDVLDAPSAAGAPERHGAPRLEIVRVDLASGERRVLLTQALEAALSRDGSQLASVSLVRPGALTLMVADPEGRSARDVLAGASFDTLTAPRFSPDGRRIIFSAVGGPATDPQGLPPAARQPPLERLVGMLAAPAAQAHGSPWDLWSVNSDGSGLRRLTFVYADQPVAAFSPDGGQIAFMAQGGIYLMNADGSQLRRVDRSGSHGGLDWRRAPDM